MVGEVGSNPPTTTLQQELTSLSILTCSDMSDVYPTINSEAMADCRLQEEGNQIQTDCQLHWKMTQEKNMKS
jgi:hypothetical protein